MEVDRKVALAEALHAEIHNILAIIIAYIPNMVTVLFTLAASYVAATIIVGIVGKIVDQDY